MDTNLQVTTNIPFIFSEYDNKYKRTDRDQTTFTLLAFTTSSSTDLSRFKVDSLHLIFNSTPSPTLLPAHSYFGERSPQHMHFEVNDLFAMILEDRKKQK